MATVPFVLDFAMFQIYQSRPGLYPLVPVLYVLAEGQIWFEDLPAFVFGMFLYLRHLFVESLHRRTLSLGWSCVPHRCYETLQSFRHLMSFHLGLNDARVSRERRLVRGG